MPLDAQSPPSRPRQLSPRSGGDSPGAGATARHVAAHDAAVFQMSNLQGPLVQEWEQWYSTRPDYVARMIDRSSHFLYHVMEEIERRGMPAEIALLP
jgi:membrane-bound lytic murein transglycosylase D